MFAPPNPSDVLNVARIFAGLEEPVLTCKFANSTSSAATLLHGGMVFSRIAIIARIISTAPRPAKGMPEMTLEPHDRNFREICGKNAGECRIFGCVIIRRPRRMRRNQTDVSGLHTGRLQRRRIARAAPSPCGCGWVR